MVSTRQACVPSAEVRSITKTPGFYAVGRQVLLGGGLCPRTGEFLIQGQLLLIRWPGNLRGVSPGLVVIYSADHVKSMVFEHSR